MHRDDIFRLRHMLDAAREAVAFTEGLQRAQLDQNRMLVLAVVKSLEIVGEAASKVSEPTKAAMSGIPWHAIIAMRHRLVHGYFDINLDILWNTVAEDLLPVIITLEIVLDKTHVE